MSLESDIALLRDVPLFEDLTSDQLRLLAFGAEHRRLKKGETLFRAEARADAGFIIESGTVSLYRGRAGAQRLVGSFTAGTLLGEMALLTETRRAATAVTDTECEFIRIARPLFRRMLAEYPEIAAGLHDRLTERLLDLTTRIAELAPRFDD